MPLLRLLGNMPDRLTSSGVLMTKEFEGFSPDIYLDTRKKRTVGYGFNIDDETVSKILPEDVVSGRRPISKEEADTAFGSLYSRAKEDAVSYLGEKTFDKLDRDRQDVITDMAYNLGRTRLSTFKKLKTSLEEGDYDKAAEEMKSSKWYEQVGNRAKALIRKMEETKGRIDFSRLNLFRMGEVEVAEFSPEGRDYDYNTAQEAGLSPDVTGHWPSIDPRTGMILKGKDHPTWDLTLQEEKKLGNKIIKKGDRYYSTPKVEMPGLKLLGDKPAPRPAAEPERPGLRLLGEERRIISPETERTLEFRPAPPGWRPGAPLTEEERARATVQLITGERPGLIERKLGITPLRLSQHITEAVVLPIWKGWSTFKSSIVSLMKGERPEPLRAEYGFMDLIPPERKPQAIENIIKATAHALIPEIGGEVHRDIIEKTDLKLSPQAVNVGLGLAELAIDLPAIIASAKGWQHLKGMIGKKMGESFVKKMEPVLRPAIGQKGMEAIPKATEAAARRAPIWRFPKAIAAAEKVPWAARPTRLALPEASIMEFYAGMPMPKFKVGQEIIDIAGKVGTVKGISAEAGITIYSVAYPGVKELARLGEGVIRPKEVVKPPVEPIPIEPPEPAPPKPAVEPPAEKPLFAKGQPEEQKLLEFQGMIRGEGFTAVPATPELRKFVRGLPENIQKREAIAQYEKLFKTLGKPLAKTKTKALIRRVTGQVKIGELAEEGIALAEVLKKEAQISRMAAVEARKVATKKFRRHAQTVKTQARERRDIREETNRLLERIRRVDTSKMSAISAEGIGDIKDILDFTKPSKKTLASLNETRRYLEQDPEAELPDYVYEDLMRLEKLDRSEITLEELRSLADAVDHQVTLERTKQEIRVGLEMRRMDEVRIDAVLEMRPLPKIKEDIVTSQKGKLPKLKATGQLIVDTFGVRHDHYDLVVESLSGPNSTMDKVLYQGVKEGITKERAYRQMVFRQFQEDLVIAEFMRRHGISDIGTWLTERIKVRQFDLTRGERMALYRHSLNENNYMHIVEGGFALKQAKDPYTPIKVSEEDLEAIINSLDEAERTFAGTPLDSLFERQYNALNEVFRAKNGFDLPREDFYYPIEVMRLALPKELEADSILEELKHKWVRIGLRKGMLRKRRHSKLPIYLNSVSYDVNKSVLNAAAYVGLEIPLSHASKLIYDKAFKNQLMRRYGHQVWKEIEKGLRDIAGDFQSYSTVEELLMGFRSKLTTAILGLNPFVALKQVLSFSLYSTYVKPEYLLQGFGDHITHPKELMERHKLHSPEYVDRVEGGYSRDVADVFKTGAEKKLYAGRKSIRESVMGGVKLLDLNAVNPGMQGAVLQVLDELKKGILSPEVKTAIDIQESDIPALSPEDRMRLAYKFADWTTERTQPMFSLEHRSSLSRGVPAVKLLTQFTSFTNQALNLVRRTWREARRTNDPKIYAKLAKVLFLLLVVNSGGVMMIDNLRSRIYRSKYRKKFGEAILDSVASYFYFIRELERSAVSKIKRGTFRGYDISIPVLEMANTVVNALTDGAGMFLEDTQKKRQKRAGKFVDNALTSLSMLTGIPYRTPKKIIEAVIKPEKKVKKRELRILRKRKLRTLDGRTLRLLK